MEHSRPGASTTEHQEQLEQLWKEMIDQDNDEYIEFLQTLLTKTKELVHGELDEMRYFQTVEELREHMLKDI